jgi:toxin FitB
MIVVDTNVLSEPLKPRPDPAILQWFDSYAPESFYLAAPVLAEILNGIEPLPKGKRKHAMEQLLQSLMGHFFADRFLAFDREAAIAYARLGSRTAEKGYTISVIDCQIAAIAAVHGFAVATRDVAPFRAAGVPVINPWQS